MRALTAQGVSLGRASADRALTALSYLRGRCISPSLCGDGRLTTYTTRKLGNGEKPMQFVINSNDLIRSNAQTFDMSGRRPQLFAALWPTWHFHRGIAR